MHISMKVANVMLSLDLGDTKANKHLGTRSTVMIMTTEEPSHCSGSPRAAEAEY